MQPTKLFLSDSLPYYEEVGLARPSIMTKTLENFRKFIEKVLQNSIHDALGLSSIQPVFLTQGDSDHPSSGDAKSASPSTTQQSQQKAQHKPKKLLEEEEIEQFPKNEGPNNRHSKGRKDKGQQKTERQESNKGTVNQSTEKIQKHDKYNNRKGKRPGTQVYGYDV